MRISGCFAAISKVAEAAVINSSYLQRLTVKVRQTVTKMTRRQLLSSRIECGGWLRMVFLWVRGRR
jgi:hypothetical protein